MAILLIYALFFLGVYLFFIALVPQLYRELARISRDGVAFLNSLTPERVHQLADRAEDWLAGQWHSGGHRHARGDPRRGAHHGPVAGPGENHSGHGASLTAFVREHMGDIVTVSRSIITSVLAGVFMTVLHPDGGGVLLHRRAAPSVRYVTSAGAG